MTRHSLAVCGALVLCLLGVSALPASAQTFTLPASADTFLRDGAANRNSGGEAELQLSGNQRAVLRVDQAAVAAAVGSGRVVSASLELFVRSANGWGSDGRLVEAHRVTASWTEMGATWNCAVDTQPSNGKPDCASRWNGGAFEEDASDTVVHTNDVEDHWVQFDVTADVAAFLVGTPNQGWLLKREEEAGAGRVDYAAREGGSSKRPRLVLLVETAAHDQVPPSLTITSPVRSILVNEPSPTVTVEYADGGSGVNTATLQVLLDGQDVTSSCTAQPQSASCHPAALAAGSHTLQARLRDHAGNLAQASFAFQLLLGSGPHLVTFQAVADTYLRKGEANRNFGAEPVLRLRQGGQNRSLVQIDPQNLATTLAGATLVSAALELHIEKNGGNWGQQGRLVGAHRLTAAWTEQGATWNCPVDTNPSNSQPNCAAQWNGGSFAASPTASVLHTKDLTGWVSFDVTADVAAFAAGAPNRGWLIKKREDKKSGRVDYDSRQGTAGEGPRLVVVFTTTAPGDTTAPEVVVLRPGAGLASNQASAPIVVSYSDDGSGVALGTLQVSVDGVDVTASCEVKESSAACASQALASGSHTVLARIRDAAGNQGNGSQTFSFLFDQMPPTITASVAPAPNAAGWNNTPVTVTFSCADVGSGLVACPPPVVVEAEGEARRVVETALDQASNATTVEVIVNIDRTPPAVEISSPAPGEETNAASTGVAGSVADRFGVASVDLNGTPLAVSGGSFTASASLADGANALTVTARDRAGNTGSASVQVNRFAIPEVAVTAPAPQTRTEASVMDVEGTVSPGVSAVTVNGVAAAVSGATFSAAGVPLLEGNNILAAVAVDGAGRVATATVQVIRDPRPPRLAVHSPVDGAVVAEATVSVQGMVNDLIIGSLDTAEAEVRVNGILAQVANRSFLAAGVPLSPGPNVLTVTATDLSGNSSTAQLTVIRQDAPAGQPRLRVVSGDLQSAPVGTVLAVPLVASLTDATGLPLAGRQLVFRVAEGDGALASGGAPARTLALTSDAQGRAQVSWTLGTRAGAGKNRVEVTTPGLAGAAVFLATGEPGEPAEIIQDAGTRQFGLVSQRLPHPFVAVVTDPGDNRLAGVPVTFQVTEGGGSFDGEQTVIVDTDAYGRALALLTLGPEEGIENNVVAADFPGSAGFSAVFRATGQRAGEAAATRIRGVVLDNSNLPISGVTVRVEESGQTTRTDAQGQFLLTGVPVGRLRLIVEGSTADRPGNWPSLDYEMVTVPGRENVIGMPVYLLPIDLAHGIVVDETRGGRLTVPSLPGFALEIAPGSATFPGGGRSGVVSVTLVHSDKVPMVPNFGQQPRFIVTIQPAGTRFDPPAAMTLPNVDGLAPGQVTEMYSFDHDLGMFVSIGTASVSADGSVLRSDPGVGVVEGGWHCGGNPPGPGGAESANVQITSPKPQKVQKDKTVTLTATGGPAGGTFEWTTDRPDVVSFQGSTSGSSVVIKALRANQAKVKVKYTCPSGATAEEEVQVRGHTPDVTVVAWVNGTPVAAQLEQLRPQAGYLIRADMSNPVTCNGTVLIWLVTGIAADVFTDVDRRFVNAFLLANSANQSPGTSIDPDAVGDRGDYRMWSRYQVSIDDREPRVDPIQEPTPRIGNTPNPCGGAGVLPFVPAYGAPEVHPNNWARGLTSSRTGAYILSEGRLGSDGQEINETLNGRTTPWIWSVIRFDLKGELVPSDIDHQMFPTYYVYADGQLIRTYPQSDAEAFISLNASSQRLPNEVP